MNIDKIFEVKCPNYNEQIMEVNKLKISPELNIQIIQYGPPHYYKQIICPSYGSGICLRTKTDCQYQKLSE